MEEDNFFLLNHSKADVPSISAGTVDVNLFHF